MWNALKALFGSKPETNFAKQKMDLDHQEVPKRFVGGILAINYEVDPAYDADHSRMAVNDWYGIESREELIDRISYFLGKGNSTPAYDAFRGVFLARAGLPAGLLSVEESWRYGLQGARKVQAAYDGWMAFGMGYIEGHLNHRRGQGDDEVTLNQYRSNLMKKMAARSAGIWGSTPFGSFLGHN